jgi:hypothetical protein
VLHAEHHRTHQRRHRGVKALDRHGFDTAHRGRTAGIVEQAVKPAPSREAGLDHRSHVAFLRGVCFHEQAFVLAQRLLERAAKLLAAAGRHHPGAFLHKDLDGAPADAAGGARHDGDLAVEPAHDDLL